MVSGTIRKMLSGDFIESRGEMSFPEISAPILEKVIQYFYYKKRYANSSTSTVPEFQIEPEYALELLMASNYLDCWHYSLRFFLNPFNVKRSIDLSQAIQSESNLKENAKLASFLVFMLHCRAHFELGWDNHREFPFSSREFMQVSNRPIWYQIAQICAIRSTLGNMIRTLSRWLK